MFQLGAEGRGRRGGGGEGGKRGVEGRRRKDGGAGRGKRGEGGGEGRGDQPTRIGVRVVFSSSIGPLLSWNKAEHACVNLPYGLKTATGRVLSLTLTCTKCLLAVTGRFVFQPYTTVYLHGM